MNWLKNPRVAPAGNRTLWLVTWMFELAAISGIIALGWSGWMMRQGHTAADVVLVLGAVGAIVGAFGGYALTLYQRKSIHRAGQGSDAAQEPK